MRGHLLRTILAVSALSLCLGASASAQFGVAEEKDNPPAEAAKEDRKVTVDFNETPLRTAIDLIFAGTGLQYSIDPTVENTPITLNVRDVSVAQVVRLVVRQAAVAQKGLAYELKAGVYNIHRNPNSRADEIRRKLFGPRTSTTPSGLLKIELRHVSAANVSELLGGQVIKSTGAVGEVRVAKASDERTGWAVPEGVEGILAITADNSLVVRGTPDGVREFTDLASLIDVPQRQTSIVLNAGSLRVESIIGESEEVTLLDSHGAGRLEVKVRLQRSAEGLVANLDGQVKLNGGSRSFKTQRTLLPGLSIPITTIGSGKHPVTLYLKATTSRPTLGGFGTGGLGGGRF